MVKIPGALDGRRLLGLVCDGLVSHSQHWRFFEDLCGFSLLEIQHIAVSPDILPREHLQILMKVEHPSLVMQIPIPTTPLSQTFPGPQNPPIRIQSTVLDIILSAHISSAHFSPHLPINSLVAVTLPPIENVSLRSPILFLPQK